MKQYKYLFEQPVVKEAGVGRLLGTATRFGAKMLAAPVVLPAKAIGWTARKLAPHVKREFSDFGHGLMGRRQISAATQRAAKQNAPRQFRTPQAPPPQTGQAQAAPTPPTPTPAAPPQPAPAASTPPPASSAPTKAWYSGAFDTAKSDLSNIYGNARAGNWQGIMDQARANPLRHAGYAAGGAYGLGTAKDTLDAMTGSDEYDYGLWDKIKMGIGMEQRPSVVDPFLPFFLRGYHAN